MTDYHTSFPVGNDESIEEYINRILSAGVPEDFWPHAKYSQRQIYWQAEIIAALANRFAIDPFPLSEEDE